MRRGLADDDARKHDSGENDGKKRILNQIRAVSPKATSKRVSHARRLKRTMSGLADLEDFSWEVVARNLHGDQKRRAFSRYDFDGPAWFQRMKTGYKGPAWYDLPVLQHQRSPRKRSRSNVSGSQNMTTSRHSGAVPSKDMFEKLGHKIPIWMNLENAEHTAALFFRCIWESQQNRMDSLLNGQRSESEWATEESQSMNAFRASLEVDLEAAAELERDLRIKDLILAMAEARRNARQLEERLIYKAGIPGIAKLEHEDYHLPLTESLLAAKEKAVDIQADALRRNWFLIKTSFDRSGGVLGLRDLRETVLAIGITPPHAARVMLRASQTLLPGEDLVSYDDFVSIYFPNESSGYETDSDLEDYVSVCIDNSPSLPSDHYNLEPEANDVINTMNQGENQITHAKTKTGWSSKDEVSAEKEREGEEDQSARLFLRFVQTNKQDKFNLDEIQFTANEVHARKVLRIKRKIKAAMRTKMVQTGGSEGLTLDNLLDMAGTSIVYLKVIDKKWLKQRQVAKSSRLVSSFCSKMVDEEIYFERAPGGRMFPFEPNEVVDIRSIGNMEAMDYIPSQDSLAQVISIIQGVACLRIQRLARGYVVRTNGRYYFQQAVLAKHILHKANLLIEKWFRVSKRQFDLRKHALRYFIHWSRLVRLATRHRLLFRLCFWPFFIWRRYAFRKINARSKAKFLRRVWTTYWTMRHFRAWRRETLRKKRVIEKSLEKILNRRKDQAQTLFFTWKKYARQTKVLKEKWESGGKALQARVTKKVQLRLWSCWRVYVSGNRACRQRSVRYYNYVPYLFNMKQKFIRSELELAPRGYQNIEDSAIPSFPSLRELVGPVATQFLDSDRRLKKVCKNYRATLLEVDRLGRAHTCIQRNVLGPKVFKLWREAVEAGQKDRYAWYKYVQRVQKRAFLAWAKETGLRGKPEWQRSNSVRLSRGPSTRSIASDQKKSATPKNEETKERDLDALFAADEAVRAEEEERQKRIAEERLKMAEVHERRAKVQENWAEEAQWRRKNLSRFTKQAEELQKERLFRQAKLRAHEERLEYVKDNELQSAIEAEKILDSKKKELEETKLNQLEHAEKLRRMRGHLLHDVMCKVIDEVEQENMKQMIKTCFRMLRFPVLARKSFSMLQRRRLLNLVRICVRMRKIWRAMPKYRELRIKWEMFNKWLRFVDNVYTYESPGLREEIARKRILLCKYSKLIHDEGEEHVDGRVKSKSVWFYRWVEYTQKQFVRGQFVALMARRSNFLLLRKIWGIWRSSIRPRHEYHQRLNSEPFLAKRAAFDIQRIKHKMFAVERSLLSTKLRSRNLFVRMKARESVLANHNEHKLLKKVMEKHQFLANARLELEKRLLCTAFEERGTYTFHDKQTHVLGVSLENLEGGKLFQDLSCGPAMGVYSVFVGVSEGMIVSLQLKMRVGNPATARTTVFAPHGYCPRSLADSTQKSGSGHAELRPEPGLEVYEFQMVDPFEKLVCIEGYALDHVFGGKIRFRTSLGRVSPWYGSGEAGKRFVLPSGREKNAFGTFRFVEEFIVGFFGAESDTSILSLGVILRQVDQTNVFSRCWMERADLLSDDISIQDSIEDQQEFITEQKAQHERQFNTVLSMRCSDVKAALKRSLRFAMQVRYGSETPKVLRKVEMVDRLMRWSFNAWSGSLVKIGDISNQTKEEPRRRGSQTRTRSSKNNIAKGYMLMHQGNAKLKDAKVRKRELENLLGYGATSDKLLNEAHIGSKRFRDLTTELKEQNKAIEEAKLVIAEGRAIVDKGLLDMPKLDTSPRSLAYYEDLVRLATIKDQIKL